MKNRLHLALLVCITLCVVVFAMLISQEFLRLLATILLYGTILALTGGALMVTLSIPYFLGTLPFSVGKRLGWEPNVTLPKSQKLVTYALIGATIFTVSFLIQTVWGALMWAIQPIVAAHNGYQILGVIWDILVIALVMCFEEYQANQKAEELRYNRRMQSQ